ncbi:MAG: Na+/H+ antiporter NhaA [Ferrovum sp.]|nr:Na+/H+ antiporter NhaA [Ferrovum sp.]NDU87421.1 Na+/H+ antiporter NhaA [Ferrovum sp.]
MTDIQTALSRTFNNFFKSETSSGVFLIFCTLASLALANSPMGHAYLGFWHCNLAGLSLEHWVNDGLMAIFFLLVGLELKRELYSGELSNLKNALLPVVAAFGGIVVPASIHFFLNAGTPTQAGTGIPMATDIAFALGILALLGNRVPTSLKIFLTALAVIDDLGAIIVIALFYTTQIYLTYFFLALGVFVLLLILNRAFKVMSVPIYLLGGILMWFFMLKSGVHATISGVLLAFALPSSAHEEEDNSPSVQLENLLHKPVAFMILPLFALANTGFIIRPEWQESLSNSNSLGIIAGLVIGKPAGIALACLFAVATKVCQLPSDLKWSHIVGAGLLGGIGFTMSIFIANLAFAGKMEIIDASKLAILASSLAAGTLGFLWLKYFTHESQNLAQR